MRTRTPAPPRTETRRRAFRPALEVLEGRHLPAALGFYHVTNLVANDPSVAQIPDAGLVNAWGISLSPGAAFWLSSHAAGASPLYTGDVTQANGTISSIVKAGFTVIIPNGTPTGQLFNTTTDFVITSGTQSAAAFFIFASESGTISGWRPGVGAITQAHIGVSDPTSSFTGLGLANNGSGNFLYAADFKNGTIDVFNATFTPTTLAGSFTDPAVPRGFKPFNVQNLGGELFVTYARDHDGDAKPDGHQGFVSVFDANGNFLRRLSGHGHLDQPWGLALAPVNFGAFSNAVLVGNHGNGRINAFDRTTGEYLGQFRDELGRPLRIDGLYGLVFGNGRTSGDSNALYFAAGPNGGTDGLFGSIRVAEGKSVGAVLTAVLGKIGTDGGGQHRGEGGGESSGGGAVAALLNFLDGDKSGKGDDGGARLERVVSALDRIFGEDVLFSPF